MTIDSIEPGKAPNPRGMWRILGPALACWASTAALIHFPGAALAVAACAAVAGAGITVYFLRTRERSGSAGSQSTQGSSAGSLRSRCDVPLGVVLITCAVLTMLGARIDVLERARESAPLIAAVDAGTSVSVSVRVAGYPQVMEQENEASRAFARAQIMAIDEQRLPRAVPVMLWLSNAATGGWANGTTLVLTGTLSRAAPESRVAYEMKVHEVTDPAKEKGGLRLFAMLDRLPSTLRESLNNAARLQPGARLVPGLAVGDTSLIDAQLEEIMIESSLTHLVAVSGSNCALIIAAAVFASSRMGAGRRARIVIAAGALGAFVVLVGPDASVQRASIMAGVLLLSNFSGKSRQALPSLGVAVLVLLAIDPWQAIQAGFALSVAATGGILLGVAPLERWLRTRLRLPRVLALPIAVACIAQFACAPLLLLLQPGIPVAGVFANILAAPAAPAGTALGMVAMLLLPMHAGVGEIILWFATWPARWIEACGVFGVSLPMGRWFWPGGWPGASLLFAVQALLIAVWIGGGRFIGPWKSAVVRPLRVFVSLKLIGGIAAGLITAVVIVVPVTVRAGVPENWFMVACDVGQGDAILLRDPQDPEAVMVVDVGDDPAKLGACLDLFGVKHIDLLVLTHDHRDHIGAVAGVLGKTERALISPPAREHQQDRPLLGTLRGGNTAYGIGAAGMTGGRDSGMRWEILGPKDASVYSEVNATCLVLLVDIDGVQIVLLGDTGEGEQRWLASEYPNLRADVVKVAHHGSRDQAPAFYSRLSVSTAVISVGENSYGHPNNDLVDDLSISGSAVLRTDVLGSIALSAEDPKPGLRGADPHARDAKPNIVPWAAGERSAVGRGLNVWGSR